MSAATLRQETVTKYGRSSHWYVTPGGERLPSVTNILGVVGKPALINWAANTEREMVAQAASELYADLPEQGPKMSTIAYQTTLLARLGKVKAHTKQLAAAADIGRQTHGRIEWEIRKALGQKVGPEPKLEDKALWAFMVYEDWRKTVQLTPVAVEQVLWHPQRRYAGTMDLLAKMVLPGLGPAPSLVVVDWKTGKGIYGEALLQNAAYTKALIAMKHAGAAPPVHGVVVRLPKVDTDPAPEVRVIPWEAHEGHYQTFLAVKTLWHWQQVQDTEYEARKAAAETPTRTLIDALKASVADISAPHLGDEPAQAGATT